VGYHAPLRETDNDISYFQIGHTSTAAVAIYKTKRKADRKRPPTGPQG
jgi:hypothetical protein